MPQAPDTGEVERGPRPTYALLRERDYAPFVTANLVSNAGNWFHVIAAVLVVFEMTGSATMVGLVSAATFGIFLLLSPVAGWVTDRVDRRRLLISSQSFSAAAAAALAVWTAVGLPSHWPVIGLSAVIALGFVFGIPAMLALVPALVPPEDLAPAIALNTVAINLARVVGPAAGAMIVVRYGAAVAFAVNAASFVAIIAALLVVRPRPQLRAQEGERSIVGGIAFMWRDRRSIVLLIGVGAIGFAMDATSTLTPPIAAMLDAGEPLVGWLVSAFGLGAVATSFGHRRLSVRTRHVAPIGIALCGAGLGVVAVSVAPWMALGGFAILGSGYLLGITDLTTELQHRSPEELHGRIMAVWSQVLLGARPIAALATGGLADAWSPRAASAAGALVAAAAVAVLVVVDAGRGAASGRGPLTDVVHPP